MFAHKQYPPVVCNFRLLDGFIGWVEIRDFVQEMSILYLVLVLIVGAGSMKSMDVIESVKLLLFIAMHNTANEWSFFTADRSVAIKN